MAVEVRAPARAGGSDPESGRWWREASGAFADLGVLVPIAVTLIVVNGLSATAVLLPAGVLYVTVAAYYRLPVAVQPLKAFGAIAIAVGAGPEVIAAGALLLGGLFLLLSAGPWLNRIAEVFPRSVIRGIQLSVGLLFAEIAWKLVTAPQPAFTDQLPQPWLLVLAVLLLPSLLLLRHRLLLVVLAAAVGWVLVVGGAGGPVGLGPSPISGPELSWSVFRDAAVLLVLPQLPLTFANSCLAPADAARRYFGTEGERVTPARLARTLGGANLFAGAISGMPVCHGAGGLSAHHAFGARTWRAPLLIGATLLVLALGFGAVLAQHVGAFPLPLLAALLGVAAIVHIGLLRDLRGGFDISVAVGVGIGGLLVGLGPALVVGLAVAWARGKWRRHGADEEGERG